MAVNPLISARIDDFRSGSVCRVVRFNRPAAILIAVGSSSCCLTKMSFVLFRTADVVGVDVVRCLLCVVFVIDVDLIMAKVPCSFSSRVRCPQGTVVAVRYYL